MSYTIRKKKVEKGMPKTAIFKDAAAGYIDEAKARSQSGSTTGYSVLVVSLNRDPHIDLSLEEGTLEVTLNEMISPKENEWISKQEVDDTIRLNSAYNGVYSKLATQMTKAIKEGHPLWEVLSADAKIGGRVFEIYASLQKKIKEPSLV